MLDQTPDELLSTTRAVRKRLDVERPVPDELVRECVAASMQAPSGSNNMTMQFVVVSVEEKRRALGEVYRQCYEIYKGLDGIYVGSNEKPTAPEQARQKRMQTSADHHGEHMDDAPVLVLGCTGGRADGLPAMMSASMMGNVLKGTDFKPAVRPEPDTIIHRDTW